WLSPNQVNIIPVNNKIHLAHVEKIKKQLKSKGIRVNVDKSEEKMGYKIRNAQVKKVPYTIVIGDDEVSNNTLSVRKHGGNSEQIFELSNFIEKVIKEINIL
ncbi:His/Gly/Thr/Pro-type tRNA ligase C-terminal domain-containing protein, partial [Staphylococcus shinii]